MAESHDILCSSIPREAAGELPTWDVWQVHFYKLRHQSIDVRNWFAFVYGCTLWQLTAGTPSQEMFIKLVLLTECVQLRCDTDKRKVGNIQMCQVLVGLMNIRTIVESRFMFLGGRRRRQHIFHVLSGLDVRHIEMPRVQGQSPSLEHFRLVYMFLCMQLQSILGTPSARPCDEDSGIVYMLYRKNNYFGGTSEHRQGKCHVGGVVLRWCAHSREHRRQQHGTQLKYRSRKRYSMLGSDKGPNSIGVIIVLRCSRSEARRREAARIAYSQASANGVSLRHVSQLLRHSRTRRTNPRGRKTLSECRRERAIPLQTCIENFGVETFRDSEFLQQRRLRRLLGVVDNQHQHDCEVKKLQEQLSVSFWEYYFVRREHLLGTCSGPISIYHRAEIYLLLKAAAHRNIEVRWESAISETRLPVFLLSTCSGTSIVQGKAACAR